MIKIDPTDKELNYMLYHLQLLKNGEINLT